MRRGKQTNTKPTFQCCDRPKLEPLGRDQHHQLVCLNCGTRQPKR